jgi:hypothetical protein
MGKSIMIGIGVFVLGFVVSVLLSLVFYSGDTEHSYYYAIIFSTLYLSAIVAISTSLMITELKKPKN